MPRVAALFRDRRDVRLYPPSGTNHLNLGHLRLQRTGEGTRMHRLVAHAKIAALCGMGSGLVLILAGVSGPALRSQAQQLAPSPGVAASPAPTATPLSLDQLTSIQPGLSGFMMEAAQRVGIMWFAAQQGNWDLAAFEGRETKDTLHRGGLKSNQSRQQGIEAFNS